MLILSFSNLRIAPKTRKSRRFSVQTHPTSIRNSELFHVTKCSRYRCPISYQIALSTFCSSQTSCNYSFHGKGGWIEGYSVGGCHFSIRLEGEGASKWHLIQGGQRKVANKENILNKISLMKNLFLQVHSNLIRFWAEKSNTSKVED